MTICPEFMADAIDDLHGVGTLFAPEPPRVGPLHPMMARMVSQVRRHAGLVGPEHGGCLDGGFLLACNELAPDLFGDLAAWRFGAPSVDGPAYATDRKTGNKVKSFAIASGVVSAPRRQTAADKARAEAQRWGLV